MCLAVSKIALLAKCPIQILNLIVIILMTYYCRCCRCRSCCCFLLLGLCCKSYCAQTWRATTDRDDNVLNMLLLFDVNILTKLKKHYITTRTLVLRNETKITTTATRTKTMFCMSTVQNTYRKVVEI